MKRAGVVAAAIATWCCFSTWDSLDAAEHKPFTTAAGMPVPKSASEDPMVMTAAAEDQKVLVFEVNGVRLYVPEPRIWVDKTRWQQPSGDSFPAIRPGRSIASGGCYRPFAASL